MSRPGIEPFSREPIASRIASLSAERRARSAACSVFPDAFVRRIRQNDAIVDTDGATVIEAGATLAIAGYRPAQLAAGKLVGPEIDDIELLSFPVQKLDVIVTSKIAAACTVQELQNVVVTRTGHRIFISGLTRSGHKIEFLPETQLQRHDVLTLIGARADVEKAARFLGYADRAGISSDIAFMSIAVALGSLVGAITLRIGGIPLSLSPSVGALVAGLVCGQLRSAYRTFGRIPAPALWVFNNVGLNGFIAVVGLNAATGLIAGLKAYGVGLFLAGVIVSMVPLIVGLLAGKYIFRFHPGILLGACAGARSTTAALGAVQEAANSTIPAIGYTIPYAVSRIVMALGGVIIVVLTR